MKQKKEPLKTRNPRKYYSIKYHALYAGEWACLLGPLFGVFGAKWNEYVQFASSQDGSVLGGFKLTVGAVLSLLVAVFVIYKGARHKEKVDKTATMSTFALGIGVAFALSWAFSVILKDLTLILGCEFAGAMVAYPLDTMAQKNKKLMEIADEEMIRENTRRNVRREHNPYE